MNLNNTVASVRDPIPSIVFLHKSSTQFQARRSQPNASKMRSQVTIARNQESLTLLAENLNGSSGEPKIDESSSKPWTAPTVADKFGVSRAAIIYLKKNAASIMCFSENSNNTRKVNRITDGQFPEM